MMIKTRVNITRYYGFFFQIWSYIFADDLVHLAALWLLSKELLYL